MGMPTLRWVNLQQFVSASDATAKRRLMQVNGASDVSFFGMKSEGNLPVVWVRNCSRVRGYAYGGNAAALPYNGRCARRALHEGA